MLGNVTKKSYSGFKNYLTNIFISLIYSLILQPFYAISLALNKHTDSSYLEISFMLALDPIGFYLILLKTRFLLT